MATAIQRQKLSVPELAKLWGVSTNKIHAFIWSGELRATNLATDPNRRPQYAIDVRDIESFEARREIVPAAPKLRRRAPQGVKEFV